MKIFCVILCAICVATVCPQDATKSIEGYYSCVGADSHESYTGIVSIKKHGPDAYRILYYLEGNPHATVGIGFRKGDRLIVSATPSIQQEGRTVISAIYYKIEGKNLVGEWVMVPGSGEIKKENLEFIKGFPVLDQ